MKSKMSTSHETILYINLNALENNFNYLKSVLKSETKVFAVVKAFAYGHGDIAIAKKLETLGVNGFWVADFEEGMNLRKAGINKKIIVANPGIKSYDEIIKYNLEPVIYNFRLLKLYGKKGCFTPIHIKFNSGMNRYGFNMSEIKNLTSFLMENLNLKVDSICSHLSVVDNKSKDFLTKKQLLNFDSFCKLFTSYMKIKPEKHILNTSGILRFPKYQKDIVRMGIGLYGVSHDKNLMPIAKLISNIAQIREIKKGENVGYDASFKAKSDMKIGIIPLGYADGINRKLGNKKGTVIINNFHVPIIGKISMDSFMVDISNINPKEGDPVIIFGAENSVLEIANSLGTIPYEILATLNRRIKRIYN